MFVHPHLESCVAFFLCPSLLKYPLVHATVAKSCLLNHSHEQHVKQRQADSDFSNVSYMSLLVHVYRYLVMLFLVLRPKLLPKYFPTSLSKVHTHELHPWDFLQFITL